VIIKTRQAIQYDVSVPAEPPVLSVVLSRSGLAWQRAGRNWHSAGTPSVLCPQPGGVALSWAQLLLTYGPVTLVHAPEKDNREDPK